MHYSVKSMSDNVIPDFENETGYLPYGKHKPSFKEFEARFVVAFPDSETRSEIMLKYKQHCKELISLDIAEKQWIDGSYVTNVVNPGDIDLLTQFNGLEMDQKGITKEDVENVTCDMPLEKDGGLCHSFPVVWYPKEKEDLYEDYWNTKVRYLVSIWGMDNEYTLKGLIEFDIDILEGALIEK